MIIFRKVYEGLKITNLAILTNLGQLTRDIIQIRTEIYGFVLYMACGGMIFIETFSNFRKKKFFI